MEESQLPTLDDFLSQSWRWPKSSYINYPGFSGLYVRKSDIYLLLGGVNWFCRNVITVANITAEKPGQGSFQRLLEDLCSRGLAVYVENVHNPRFAKHLMDLGFVPANCNLGAPNFIYGHQGHLSESRK